MVQPTRLTIVTVVFETEVALLRLQARSVDRYFPGAALESLIVIDNSAHGLPGRARQRLVRDYGVHGPKVRFLRPDMLAQVPRASGWLVQQVLKLEAARHVATSHYLVLDAKDHFVRASAVADFIGPDGLPRIPAYSYRTHPLRPQLETVLTYLGIDPAAYVDRFSATVTPFALETGEVGRMMASIASRRADGDFAREFVEHGLLEFFLYAGWLLSERGSLERVFDLLDTSCPKVWKGTATRAGVRAAVAMADRDDAPVFSVHRRALPRLPWAALVVLAEFWARRDLFDSRGAALRFALAFRVQYVVREVARKVRQRLS